MCTACRRTTQKAAAPIHTSPAHTSHMYNVYTHSGTGYSHICIHSSLYTVYILHRTLYTFYTVYFTLYTVQVYINTLYTVQIFLILLVVCMFNVVKHLTTAEYICTVSKNIQTHRSEETHEDSET